MPLLSRFARDNFFRLAILCGRGRALILRLQVYAVDAGTNGLKSRKCVGKRAEHREGHDDGLDHHPAVFSLNPAVLAQKPPPVGEIETMR